MMSERVVRANGALVFNIFHVGKADCTFIEFPSGEKGAVIDCYRPPWRKSPIVKRLQEKVNDSKNFCLAFVCISHPHRDHVLGISEIQKINRLRIEEFWHPLPDIEEFLIMKPATEQAKLDIAWAKATQFYYDYQLKEFVSFTRHMIGSLGNQRVMSVKGFQHIPSIDGVQVYCLNPCKEALGEYKKAIHESGGRFDRLDRDLLDNISVALLFVYGDNALLYASDMQKQQWAYIVTSLNDLPDIKRHLPACVMKASHHGGPRSFYEELWDEVLRKEDGFVIASGGSATHPSKEFIESVLRANRKLLCTGRAKRCGRGRSRAKQKYFHAKRWMAQYGEQLADHLDPCYGDILITMPKTGPPSISPPHLHKQCKFVS